MSEEQAIEITKAEPITGFAEGFDPFDENYIPPVNQEIEVQEEAKVIEQVVEEVKPTVFEPNTFVKDKFGYDSVEVFEAEFKALKEQKPKEFEFDNDISKTLFNAIKEGKVDDVYSILAEQKKLEKLTTSELNTNVAAEIIKLSIQQKNKDLTSDEVDFVFNDKFNFPEKPTQSIDDTDEDYQLKIENWNKQVSNVEKRLIIEAKLAKPDLEQLKSNLKLPDIQVNPKQEQVSQEVLDAQLNARKQFEQALEADFSKFAGFNVSVKDEEVEIPISFNVADDEKVALKNSLSDFDSDTYFGNRWFDKEGKPNVNQMMADKYKLENFDKILQKVANEAAAQRLVHHLKKTGNITIDTPKPQGTLTPDASANMDRLAEWAFQA